MGVRTLFDWDVKEWLKQVQKTSNAQSINPVHNWPIWHVDSCQRLEVEKDRWYANEKHGQSHMQCQNTQKQLQILFPLTNHKTVGKDQMYRSIFIYLRYVYTRSIIYGQVIYNNILYNQIFHGYARRRKWWINCFAKLHMPLQEHPLIYPQRGWVNKVK